MPDLLITRPPSREEAARAAQRQDEDDRLNAANRILRSLVESAASAAVMPWDDHSRRDIAQQAVKHMTRILCAFTAQPIVAPYARAIREQAETITRREQIIEKLEE